jgi:uncharacterized protein YcnI
LRASILLTAATTAALTLVAAPAFAHTTANPSTTVAGAYAVIDMRVPHGCEGVATAVLDVSIPGGVVSVKPEQVSGWTVTTETGTYDEPVVMHGQELTEGVVSVTWTADDGGELPDGLFRDFGLSVKLPDAAGDTIYFPAVQTCVDGSQAAWIEIPAGDDAELAKPAPAVTLTETETETETEVEQTSDDGEAVDVINAAADTSNPAGTSGVAWAALVLALLGLGLGGAAFAKAGTTATPGTT